MKAMDECVVNACEQMKSLNPQERFHLLCEMGEWMYNPLSEEIDDVLMVPNFREKEVAGLEKTLGYWLLPSASITALRYAVLSTLLQ